MARSAVAIALPPAELAAVSAQLNEAGIEAVPVATADELEVLLNERDDIRVAILDSEYDFDRTIEMYGLLHEDGRSIPALMVVSAKNLDRMGPAGRARVADEYFTRPYSADSLRWRVEAMLIRAEVPEEEPIGGHGSGAGGAIGAAPAVAPAASPAYQPPAYQPPAYQPPAYEPPAPAPYQTPTYQRPVYQAPEQPVAPAAPTYQAPPAPAYEPPANQAPAAPAPAYQPAYQTPTYQTPAYQTPTYQAPGTPTYEPAAPSEEDRRGNIVIVFNPKGGVGKTTIAVNAAAMLQIRKEQHVLLVDCDTVTGHVASSLGMEHVRTVADAWSEDVRRGQNESFADIATVHQSGVSVLVMADSPLHTEVLEPRRVAEAITAARQVFDWVVVDMHPDYGPLNQVIFERADRILVPVTPDVPAIRAAVQFREVAVELDIRDRLAMVVNRANSGVSVGDMERTVGMPALAEIRSAGMLFVRAANEGRSAVERFPKEKVIDDFEQLADNMIATASHGAAKSGDTFLGTFSHTFNSSVRAS